MTDVSIVLPTRNRLSRLKRVIEALEAQDYPHQAFEVVVVSDGSTDGTDEYLRFLRGPLKITPLFGPSQGAAGARNRGLQRAVGRIVLFLDDDVVPSPRLVSEHVSWHCERDDTVVIGPMLTPPDHKPSPWVRWMHERLAEQYEAMVEARWQPTARQFYTGNASAPRQRLLECGGFDTSFLRAEDVELAYRLADRGLHFKFNPRAIGYHYEERSYASWAAIPYAYGRNDVIMSEQKGQPWLLETIRGEFRTRHPFHRLLINLCLDRSLVSELALRWCRVAGELGTWLGASALERLAYSSIFNLHYYQGISDALGGRGCFYSFTSCRGRGSPSTRSI